MKRVLMSTGSVVVAVTAMAMFGGGVASAQELEVEGNVALVSDYRFRGVSQTNDDAAIQGGFDLGLDSGFYVGTWGSSINFGNGSEIDVYAGYGGEAGALGYDVGVLAYYYGGLPGDDNTLVYELYGSLAATLGMIDASVGLAYIPEQSDTDNIYNPMTDALEDLDNTYFYVTGDMPLGESPFALSASVGYTDGGGVFNFATDDDGNGFGDDGVWDYSIGVSTSVVGIDLGLSYVGIDDLQDGLGEEDTVVFSISKAL